MTADKALKLAQGLLHEQARLYDRSGAPLQAKQYREAADILDDVRLREREDS